MQTKAHRENWNIRKSIHGCSMSLKLTGVSFWMADVQTCPRWVWEHIQHILLGLVPIARWSLESLVLFPVLLPFWFNFGKRVRYGAGRSGCRRIFGRRSRRIKSYEGSVSVMVGRDERLNIRSSGHTKENHCGCRKEKSHNF